nr:ATP-binding cassette domain-containing protein [Bacilli bacterium]
MTIHYRDVSIHEGRKKLIKGFTATFETGTMGIFYGSRSSAKTQLLLAAAGLYKFAQGSIQLGEIDVKKHPFQARRNVGLAASPTANPLLSHLSVHENMMVQARSLHCHRPREVVKHWLDHFGLGAYENIAVDHLSEYQIAMVGVAMAMLNDPAHVFVDEPERRLTTEETERFLQQLVALKDLGKTIIMTTRRQETLAYGDAVVHIPDFEEVKELESIAHYVSRTEKTDTKSL